MTKKYHNHTQQTNPKHCEEEPQNTYSHNTSGRQSKATSSLFLIRMIAKLERTLNTAYLMTKHRYPHPKQWKQSREEGKDQDTIWERDKNTRKHNMQESQEVSPFPS